MDNSLGHPVARGSLSTENGYTRSELLALFRRHLFDREVAVDDAKYVELLALVLMNTLDLDIEERRRVDADASRLLDVLGKANLVGILDLLEFLAEVCVIDECLNFVQEGQVFEVFKTA